LEAGGHVAGYVGAEPISPELVLVDPELARVARRLLPDRQDWTIDFEPRALPEPLPLTPPRAQADRGAGAFVRATQIGAALLLALALLGALAAEGLRRSSQRLEVASPGAPPSSTVSAKRTTKPKLDQHLPARRPRSTRTEAPVVHPSRSAPSSQTRARTITKPATVGRLSKRAIGRPGSWTIRRLGRPSTLVRQGRTCQMRWANLRLTLILSLTRPGAACSQGTVVATITPSAGG
jgi:hypothetical protein